MIGQAGITLSEKPQAKLNIRQPDDWHIHLRDGAALHRTVNDAARQFERVLVMPNLVPPVTSASLALAYRQRILEALDPGLSLDPKMSLYLTDNTTPEMVAEAAESEHIVAFKWYPAGATTNSDSGVTSTEAIEGCLAAMQQHDLILCVHGEVTDADIDIFDREKTFIDRTLRKVVQKFPRLRVIFEHITTADAVAFVRDAGERVAATITAHHLLFNRNDMLAGGIRPHYYCLPILKRSLHQEALLEAATSGDPKFFLGTDSAPHTKSSKESSCGCAGAYTANAALELYATAFESVGALNKLEDFASLFGAQFYGVGLNHDQLTLNRVEHTIPDTLDYTSEPLVPLCAGETLGWKLSEQLEK